MFDSGLRSQRVSQVTKKRSQIGKLHRKSIEAFYHNVAKYLYISNRTFLITHSI